jgi:hypothetical protein
MSQLFRTGIGGMRGGTTPLKLRDTKLAQKQPKKFSNGVLILESRN